MRLLERGLYNYYHNFGDGYVTVVLIVHMINDIVYIIRGEDFLTPAILLVGAVKCPMLNNLAQRVFRTQLCGYDTPDFTT